MATAGGSELMRAYIALKTDQARLRSDLSQARSMVSTWASDTTRMLSSLLAVNIGGGLVSQLRNVGAQFISSNAAMESYINSLSVLLRSESDARSLFKQIETLAAKTPFTTSSLTQAVTQLKVFGFTTQELIPLITTLGDAAAASPEGMEAAVHRLSYAFGQIRSAGRAQLHELRELSSVGVPVWEILAEQSGRSVAQMRSLIHHGALDADSAIAMLTAGINQRFGGMMEKQSKTWRGMMSTLSDNSAIFARKIGEPFFALAKENLSGFLKNFDPTKASTLIGTLTSKVAAFSQGIRRTQATVVGYVSTHKAFLATLAKSVGSVALLSVAMPKLRSAMMIGGAAAKMGTIGLPGVGAALSVMSAGSRAYMGALRAMTGAAAAAAGGLSRPLIAGLRLLASPIYSTISGLRMLTFGFGGLATKIPGVAMAMRLAGTTVRGLATAIPGLSTAVRLLTTSLRLLTFSNPITGILGAVGIGIIAFIKWRKEIMAFINSGNKLSAISGMLSSAWTSLQGIGERLWAGVKSVAESFWGWLSGIIEENRSEWTQWGDLAGETFTNLWDTAKSIFEGIKSAIGSALAWIGAKWKAVFGTTITGSIAGVAKAAFQFVTRFLDRLSLLTTNWKLTWELIKNHVAFRLTEIADKAIMVFNTMTAACAAAGIAIWEKIKEAGGNIIVVFSGVVRAITGLFKGLWEGLKAGFWKFGGLMSKEFTEAFSKAFNEEMAKIANDPKAVDAAEVFNREFASRMGADSPLKDVLDEITKDRERIEAEMKKAREAIRGERVTKAAKESQAKRDAAAAETTKSAQDYWQQRYETMMAVAGFNGSGVLKAGRQLNPGAKAYSEMMKSRRDAYAAAHPKRNGKGGVADLADGIAKNANAGDEKIGGHKHRQGDMGTVDVAEYAKKIQAGLGQPAAEKAQIQLAKDFRGVVKNGALNVHLANPQAGGPARAGA